ncbi:hypothetical protein JW711_05420, partial [Candidatus Woesearchaeota archaeon]|nr:hypothetical protein [Candidatus Woesearchaeota archaeon]
RDGEVLPDEPIPQPPAPVNWAADPNAPVSSAGYSDYSDEQVSIPRLGTQLQPVPAASSQAPSMSAPVEDESFTPPAAKPEIPNPRSKIAVLARDARALLSQGRVLDAEEVYMEARKIYSDLRSRHAADFSLYHELKQLYDEIQTRLSKAS